MAKPKCRPQEIASKHIDTGYFSDSWKPINVQQIHKNNYRQIKLNYRPVSLLPLCGTIFKKIMFDQIYACLDEN